jgi:hypothetical protein
MTAATRWAYGYVDGDPLNGTDPSGLICLLDHVQGGHGALVDI